MAPYNHRNSNQGIEGVLQRLQPRVAFVVMIFGALIAFEIFNYSTTEHALKDLLGDLKFIGIPWATMLSLAFCGIDFAGIARLFTPEQGVDEPKEVWYLFAAWLLAATMNAILTWWGVSMAVANHSIESTTIVDPKMIAGIVPVFVAMMVWVIRILIIGTLSLSLDRLLHPGAEQRTQFQNAMHYGARQSQQRAQSMNVSAGLNSNAVSHRANLSRAASTQPRTGNRNTDVLENEYEPVQSGRNPRPEPTYHTLSMGARQNANRTSAESNNPYPNSDNNNSRRYRS